MIIHHLSGYIQSIYLVEYPDRFLLLDGCSRPDIPIIKQFITQTLQRTFTELELVVVTHMHPDHAGAAHRLRKLTGCKIASANKTKQWYHGFVGMMMHLTDVMLALWVATKMGRARRNIWYSRKLKPDYYLNEGDVLPDFDEWQVLETPGHTDRDLSLLHMPTNKVYVADVVLKIKNKFITPFPIFHPNKYRASLQKYIDLNISTMLLAHGGEVNITSSDLLRLMQRAPKKPKTHWRAAKAKLRRLSKFN